MMGHTHMLIGFATGLAISHGAPLEQAIAQGVVCAVAAIVPDIDHPQADIRRRMGVFSHLLDWLPHRGITHTVAALSVWVILCSLFGGALALAAIAGFASHLVADMMTRSGLPLLLPLSDRRWYLLPKVMRIRTASVFEQMIAGCMALLIIQMTGIAPTAQLMLSYVDGLFREISKWLPLALG
ncbi:MAG: metal-dependent hydrolase [Chloroflexota bacterium]|nr:metal-dependent hydrolase [Chloroflexota bacterium]